MKQKEKSQTKTKSLENPEKTTYGEFPWKEFNALLQADPSKRFCGEYLNCSEDKIERAIRKEFDMTFTEYKATKLEHTVHAIKQAAISKAMGGNGDMIKYVLSNIGNWTDKKEMAIEDISDRELVEAVRAIAEKQLKNGT